MIRDVYLDYLRENYNAARHHQTMRIATTAFFLATAGVLASKAVDSSPEKLPWIGAVLIIVGMLSLALNILFHRANRLHVEIASWTRHILCIGKEAPTFSSGANDDPNIIRKSVKPCMGLSEYERDQRVFDSLNGKISGLSPKSKSGIEWKWKIEFGLSSLLNVIPSLIVFGGMVLLASRFFR